MSGAVFLFDPADRFVTGTVGQPGERAFYLQARSGSKVSSVLLEKDQVVAMVERLGLLLRELKRSDSNFHFEHLPMDEALLESPVLEEFRVGAISLSWLNDRGMVAIELHSVSENIGQSEADLPTEIIDESTDIMRVVITPAQTEMFIDRSVAVISAGRPPCPFCGMALDPRGHVCPRANGYRR